MTTTISSLAQLFMAYHHIPWHMFSICSPHRTEDIELQGQAALSLPRPAPRHVNHWRQSAPVLGPKMEPVPRSLHRRLRGSALRPFRGPALFKWMPKWRLWWIVLEHGWKTLQHRKMAMNASSWENHLAFSPRSVSDLDNSRFLGRPKPTDQAVGKWMSFWTATGVSGVSQIWIINPFWEDDVRSLCRAAHAAFSPCLEVICRLMWEPYDHVARYVL